MPKGDIGPIKLLVVALAVVAVFFGAAWQTGMLGSAAGTGTGVPSTGTGLGKLELNSPSDPTYCPPSGEVSCDKSSYSAVCSDVSTSAPGIDVSPNAPTEDVQCGPVKYVLKNTGEGTISNIAVSGFSTNPNDIGFVLGALSPKWQQTDGNTGTISSLVSGEQFQGSAYCKYEGGQTSANQKEDIRVTGVAGSGAKTNYNTFTVTLNCTA